jgi:hypothetical protein
VVQLSIDRENARDLSMILNDGDSWDVTLAKPGTGVAVRANRPGKLRIDVVPVRPGLSTNALVKIDTLAQGEDTYEQFGDRSGVPHGVVNFASLRLLGHVAGRGDVAASANEWLAGPAVPARIEGIQIDWPDVPPGFDLRYAVFSAGTKGDQNKLVPLGTFAGTRGHALPVLALTLELAGRTVMPFQLTVEAIFLGSPPVQKSGTRITLSGPTGREPLIGFRLAIEATAVAATFPPAERTEKVESTSPTGRVRIFRSRAEANTG